MCGIGVWRYLQIAIEIQPTPLFYVLKIGLMNNASLDTHNKPKARVEYFMEFCALPPTRIAELPLSLLYFVNKWFEKTFKWLFDGPIAEWMLDAKYYHPKMFWGTAIIWIPILLVGGFYVLDLLIAGGVAAVAIVICLAVVFTVICKVIHIVNVLFHPQKRNLQK